MTRLNAERAQSQVNKTLAVFTTSICWVKVVNLQGRDLPVGQCRRHGL